MGIDVRQYAMANQDVKRAACVGCGMCAHVCPRGVLKLETKPDRFKDGAPIRVYAGCMRWTSETRSETEDGNYQDPTAAGLPEGRMASWAEQATLAS
jgi:ferredoxin